MEHFLHFIFWVLSENIWTSFPPYQPGLLLSLNFHLVFISVTQSAFIQSPCSSSKNIRLISFSLSHLSFLHQFNSMDACILKEEKKKGKTVYVIRPRMKNSLGIKIHQNCAGQSKVGCLDKQMEKAELNSAFTNSLSFCKVSSLSQKLQLQQNISQYFQAACQQGGLRTLRGHLKLASAGQSDRFVTILVST